MFGAHIIRLFVFHGLQFGEKAQRSLLANQIDGVNSKLLQLALKNIETPKRLSLPCYCGLCESEKKF